MSFDTLVLLCSNFSTLWLTRFLVALPSVRDLLLCAKHLFGEAMVAIVPARVGQ